ncbi:putative ferredoxin--NAD(+) reductase [Gordonia polyisoprenivorans VH2]|uniref:Putative ferredoxin--NAD(+) reductase n=1 Tax=Gordonia polyisoprenivorans (strain DSM 44266 / VH2) TaxID=1112204 RepID=H6MYN5_GORPV|nr:FAD-dependent oxidoreductase [Gordonia polyisoprenivorans]AFA71913.1 putative ferredoxin--NAD(+) reductase [Gordonia polyisoprenivorans VH2]WCB38291.1 FAD-dependent oxidoreductase [Gordonia polyisoprenivorans]
MADGAHGDVVLIGGGVASAATADGLREEGFDGRIVLVADEPHLPYERPPLSKEFLSGEFTHGDFVARQQQWYVDNDVELLLGTRVSALDPAAGTVTIADGGVLAYGAAVLATGVRARTLPGFTGERVHVLRSMADSARLAEQLVPGRHVVIIGAGFIGCEVAAVAVQRGVRVSVFDPNPLPLRPLGEQVGTAMAGIHRSRGVELRTGEVITSMTETLSGTVELRTGGGETVECDDVLIGIGSIPNAELAIDAGLDVDGGVLTDEFGRTSAPGVYAIGDVAARWHPAHGRRVRVEHHDSALRHGANLARTLTGSPVPFAEEPFFWTHQYEHNLQSVGRFADTADGAGTTVLRGSVRDRSFSVFRLDDGQITGMVAFDRPRDVLQARKVIGVPHRVTPDQLADEGFALKSLLPQRTRTRSASARTARVEVAP